MSDAHIYWYRYSFWKPCHYELYLSNQNDPYVGGNVNVSGEYTRTNIPTYTLHDVLNILPNWIDPAFAKIKYQKGLSYHEYVHKWICSYTSNGASIQMFTSDNPLHAVFDMLKWCMTNGLIKKSE